MMIKSDCELQIELGLVRSLIVIVLRHNKDKEFTASELLLILEEYFQTLSSINYHLNWLVRNTNYVQKNSVITGKNKHHTYQYKGDKNNVIG